MEIDDAPASVPKSAGIGPVALHISCQFYFVAERPGLHNDARPFFFAAHRVEPHMFMKSLAATRMHNPRGGADIRIPRPGEILFQKVDEPSFSLKKRKQLQGAICRGYSRGNCDRHRRDLIRGRGSTRKKRSRDGLARVDLTRRKEAKSKRLVRHNSEECGPRHPKTGPKRQGVHAPDSSTQAKPNRGREAHAREGDGLRDRSVLARGVRGRMRPTPHHRGRGTRSAFEIGRASGAPLAFGGRVEL